MDGWKTIRRPFGAISAQFLGAKLPLVLGRVDLIWKKTVWKPRKKSTDCLYPPKDKSSLFSLLRILHFGTIALLDKARGNVARDSIWFSLVSATLKCASRLKRSKKLQKLHDFSGKSWFSFCLNKDSASTIWVGSMDPKKLRVTASSTICPSSPGATGWESAMESDGVFLLASEKNHRKQLGTS